MIARRTHPARRRAMTLPPEQEAQILFEALRACHERHNAARPETVSDRVWADGYEAALRDVSSQIADRRRSALARANERRSA